MYWIQTTIQLVLRFLTTIFLVSIWSALALSMTGITSFVDLYCTPKTFAVTQVVIGLPLATVAKVFFPIGTRSWKSWMPLPIRLSIFCL